jgi:hypothetical protein
MRALIVTANKRRRGVHRQTVQGAPVFLGSGQGSIHELLGNRAKPSPQGTRIAHSCGEGLHPVALWFRAMSPRGRLIKTSVRASYASAFGGFHEKLAIPTDQPVHVRAMIGGQGSTGLPK